VVKRAVQVIPKRPLQFVRTFAGTATFEVFETGFIELQ